MGQVTSRLHETKGSKRDTVAPTGEKLTGDQSRLTTFLRYDGRP